MGDPPFQILGLLGAQFERVGAPYMGIQDATREIVTTLSERSEDRGNFLRAVLVAQEGW